MRKEKIGSARICVASNFSPGDTMDFLRFMRVAALTAATALGFDLTPLTAQAATDAFIDLNGGQPPLKGVKGQDLPGWVALTSAIWGDGRGSSSGSGSVAAGKSSQPALNITMSSKADATKLMQMAKNGTSIPVIELVDFKTVPKGLVPIYNVKFKNVMVTSAEWSGKSSDQPSLNVSLVYQTLEFMTNKQSKTDDPDTPASWEQVTTKYDLNATPP